jgi:hypothetical protein
MSSLDLVLSPETLTEKVFANMQAARTELADLRRKLADAEERFDTMRDELICEMRSHSRLANSAETRVRQLEHDVLKDVINAREVK